MKRNQKLSIAHSRSALAVAQLASRAFATHQSSLQLPPRNKKHLSNPGHHRFLSNEVLKSPIKKKSAVMKSRDSSSMTA